MKTKSIFILVVLSLFACNKKEESPSKETSIQNKITIKQNEKEERGVPVQESLNNKKKIEKLSIEDCFELINLLVKKSDFNKKMSSKIKSVGSNYYVIVDEAYKRKNIYKNPFR
jgi:cell division protein FtsX